MFNRRTLLRAFLLLFFIICSVSATQYSGAISEDILLGNHGTRHLLAADQDECTLSTSNCDLNAKCTNTVGSFGCKCNTGYSGNGVYCIDDNECSTSSPCSDTGATCTNTAGSFTCACNSGYIGTGVECRQSPAPCPVAPTNTSLYGFCGSMNGSPCINDAGCAAASKGVFTTCTQLFNYLLTTSTACDTLVDCDMYLYDNYQCAGKNECTMGAAYGCSGNATCTDQEPGYSCTCNTGYSGDGFTCTDINECTAGTDTCSDNAACTNTAGSFTCACNSGYSGDGVYCSAPAPCSVAPTNTSLYAICGSINGFPCINDAGCSSASKGVFTSCAQLFNYMFTTSTACDTLVDCATYNYDNGQCLSKNECTMGSAYGCSGNATCTDAEPGYSCVCNTGYSGDGFTCTNIDECTTGTHTCGSNAACTNTAGSFTCACNSGYIGDGITCNQFPAPCSVAPTNTSLYGICGSINGFPCINDAGCSSASKGVFTTCTQLFNYFTTTSTACDTLLDCAAYNYDNGQCYNKNECTMGSAYGCSGNATCTDTEPGYSCVCNTGYSGDGFTCTDKNECTASTHNCHSNATCTNTAGSFTCACNSGYSGDGLTCKEFPVACPTDEDSGTASWWTCFATQFGDCMTDSDCSAASKGSFTTCTALFNYLRTTGTEATKCSYFLACDEYDWDNGACLSNECSGSTSSCHVNATCTDTIDAYTCACNSGFSGDGYECTDDDECDAGTYTCHADGHCVNTAGSYTCKCNSGYAGDGKFCTADPCAGGVHDCASTADCELSDTSSVGYTCTCNSGYVGNGQSCTSVPRCGSGDANYELCLPKKEGSTSTCFADSDCQTLFGQTCLDFIMAELDNSTCNAYLNCTAYTWDNTQCGVQYVTCRKSGQDGVELCDGTCSLDADVKASLGDGTCNSYFQCPDYAWDGGDCDVDECLTGEHDCPTHSDCVNTETGFDCECHDGYTNGDDCENVDECLSSPCPSDSTCADLPGSYECTCKITSTNGTFGTPGSCKSVPKCSETNLNTGATINGTLLCSALQPSGQYCLQDTECNSLYGMNCSMLIASWTSDDECQDVLACDLYEYDMTLCPKPNVTDDGPDIISSLPPCTDGSQASTYYQLCNAVSTPMGALTCLSDSLCASMGSNCWNNFLPSWGNGVCETLFNCSLYNFDGGDCPTVYAKPTTLPPCSDGSAASTAFQLCNGVSTPLGTLTCLTNDQCKSSLGADCLIGMASSWGNGICEDMFNCEDYNLDAGDCVVEVYDPCSDYDGCHFKATCDGLSTGVPICTCNTGYVGNGTSCAIVESCTISGNNGTLTCDGTCLDLESFRTMYLDTDCDAQLNCATYNYDNGYCTPSVVACGVTGLELCDGSCKFCDDDTNCADWLAENFHDAECTAELDCEAYGWDQDSCTYDACSRGLHNCDPFASCSVDTTVSSGFTCECNEGYVGSGTYCFPMPACTSGSGYQMCSPLQGMMCLSDGSCRAAMGMHCGKAFSIGLWKNGACDSALNCAGYMFDGGDCAPVDSQLPLCEDKSGYASAIETGYGSDKHCITDEYAQTKGYATRYAFINATLGNRESTKSCTPELNLYEYYYDAASCDWDVDECVEGLHDCHISASCSDTVGSFTCECDLGYTDVNGDGTNCTDPSLVGCLDDPHSLTCGCTRVFDLMYSFQEHYYANCPSIFDLTVPINKAAFCAGDLNNFCTRSLVIEMGYMASLEKCYANAGYDIDDLPLGVMRSDEFQTYVLTILTTYCGFAPTYMASLAEQVTVELSYQLMESLASVCPAGKNYVWESEHGVQHVVEEEEEGHEFACSNMGQCDTYTGYCECEPEFYGHDCSSEETLEYLTLVMTISIDVEQFDDSVEWAFWRHGLCFSLGLDLARCKIEDYEDASITDGDETTLLTKVTTIVYPEDGEAEATAETYNTMDYSALDWFNGRYEVVEKENAVIHEEEETESAAVSLSASMHLLLLCLVALFSFFALDL